MSKRKQVYFLSDGRGHIKIGCSENPAARLSSLQTGSVATLTMLATIPGFLHGFLAADRIAGEWFKATERVTGIVEQAKEWPGADVQDLVDGAAETADGHWQFGRVLYGEHEWAGCLHGRARPVWEDCTPEELA